MKQEPPPWGSCGSKGRLDKDINPKAILRIYHHVRSHSSLIKFRKTQVGHQEVDGLSIEVSSQSSKEVAAFGSEPQCSPWMAAASALSSNVLFVVALAVSQPRPYGQAGTMSLGK